MRMRGKIQIFNIILRILRFKIILLSHEKFYVRYMLTMFLCWYRYTLILLSSLLITKPVSFKFSQ